jgi:hypothetical protein
MVKVRKKTLLPKETVMMSLPLKRRKRALTSSSQTPTLKTFFNSSQET